MFESGAQFVRADFHLHTRMDRTFTYHGDPNFFVSDYVHSLVEADISVGVITNHNLFDRDEFVQLQKFANKNNILLLPGIELTVNDGANGIHVLVVFSEEWIAEGKDHINAAIKTLFPGKTENELSHQSTRTRNDLIGVVAALNKFGKDYFFVAAHVTESSGLWSAWEGGRLEELDGDQKYAEVREKTLAFQKVHSAAERDKARIHLKSWYPAEVEGSDPKSMEQIGKGNCGYIKIGALDFNAVRFALRTPALRVSRSAPAVAHSRIDSVSYVGGIMDGTTIHLSTGLNALIGIRGSGKSAVLETIRYALELDPPSSRDTRDGEAAYKNKLVDHVLSGGGKVIVQATSRYGQQYRIERINRESHANIYVDGKLQPGLSISETIISHPIYFGQKDLAAQGEEFQGTLIDRLIGNQLSEHDRKIQAKCEAVATAVAKLNSSDNDAAQLEDAQHRKSDIEHRLAVFKQANIEDKLNVQIRFEADRAIVEKFAKGIEDLANQTQSVVDEYSDLASDTAKPTFDGLAGIAGQYDELHRDVTTRISELTATATALHADTDRVKTLLGKLDDHRTTQADTVAATMRNIEREIGESSPGVPLRPDEFLKLKKQLTQVDQAIELLSKRKTHSQSRREDLLRAINDLTNARYESFLAKQEFLNKMTSDKVNIVIAYHGDKKSFHDKLKDVVYGLKVRETTLDSVVGKYQDFADMYRDLDAALDMFGSAKQSVRAVILERLADLLTFAVPDKIEISYHGRSIAELSIGQRASALMLFVLAQCDHDLVIIDQPEDDLDNQTIYTDIIKMLLSRKQDVQFIFATHNPNIPVLGDAEQIAVCRTQGKKEHVATGSMDEPTVRDGIIKIMEGGQEAFDRRKEIYGQWN